jgi:hypothetical protein
MEGLGKIHYKWEIFQQSTFDYHGFGDIPEA